VKYHYLISTATSPQTVGIARAERFTY